MDDQTNEPIVEETDVEEAEELAPEPTDDLNELKSRLKRFEEKSIAQRERSRIMRQEIEKLKKAATPKEQSEPKTGELDETALDYLDLKGITDDDEIDVIRKVMQKTGVTVRNALKDDYVQAKLEKLRADKAVKSATPSSTKRSGGQLGEVEAAIAKYEQSGGTVLPEDFALRSAVVNALYERKNHNKPAWK